MKIFAAFTFSFLILLVGVINSVQACVARSPRDLNMAIDLESKSAIYYSNLRLFKERPKVSVQNCEMTARQNKFVMFAIKVFE